MVYSTLFRAEELRIRIEELEKSLLIVTQKYNTFEGQYKSTSHECMEMSRALKDAEKEIEEIKRLLERQRSELESEVDEKRRLQEQILALRRELQDGQQEFVKVGCIWS